MDAMFISDKDEEIWYGDKKTAEAMKFEQLKKNFHFALRRLSLSGCPAKNWPFDLKELLKKTDPEWDSFLYLASTNKTNGKLDLDFSQCRMNEKNMSLMSFALGDNKTGRSKISTLNLSRNFLG